MGNPPVARALVRRIPSLLMERGQATLSTTRTILATIIRMRNCISRLSYLYIQALAQAWQAMTS